MTAARFPTFLCRNREDVIRALAAIREMKGLSHGDLDDKAGFNDGYTGKLEMQQTPGHGDNRPSGRSAMTWAFDIWLASLGVAIMLVPLDGDAEGVDAIPAPHKIRRITFRHAQAMRALHASEEYTSWRIAALYGVPRKDVIDVILNRTHTILVHEAKRISRIAS